MNRRALVRNLMLGALVTGVAPLTGAGVDSAGAATSPAALCQSTFGESGPAGGPVVGEGPSGDPMSTTIGWNPLDWPSGLTEIVTCVSVGGRAAPSLTTSVPAPRNDGSLVIGLTLPPGEPGSLVCEQSVLLGAGGDAATRQRTTNPACFKLRAPEAAVGSGGPAAGPATPPPASMARPPVPPPATPVAATPRPTPASTPPARAAFEAARGANGMGAAPGTVPDPLVPVGLPSPAREPVSPRAVRAPGAAPQASGAPAGAIQSRTGAAAGAATGAAPTTLARTGLEHQIPLAGAGGFLALGGASIILGAPRRRRPARRSA